MGQQPNARAVADPVAAAAASPLRVLMVVERLHELGGAQQQALRLCRSLVGLGVETSMVTGRWRRSHPRHGVVGGVPVDAVFTAFKMFHIRGLRKLANPLYVATLLLYLFRKRRTYDVIHVHSATLSAFAVVLAGRWLGKPTAMKVMASGGWSDFRRMRERRQFPAGAWMLRWLRRIDKVICLNAEVEAECEAEGFLASRRISIPNGFPVREVVPRDRYEDKSSIEVVFAGRLDAQKDLRTLLHAAALLPRAPAVSIRLLGDGPQRRELEAQVSALGLGDRVRFLGRVGNVPEHLQESDIFVLPSLSEGVSNALLEAMAYGLPCVATAIPGNVDLIRDGETGLLVETGKPESLARALGELARDRSLRERLGRGGRAYVEAHFAMEDVARRYRDLYRDLVRGRLGAPES